MTACTCLAPTAQSASCLTSTAVRSPFLSWPSRLQYARSCTAPKSTPEQHSASLSAQHYVLQSAAFLLDGMVTECLQLHRALTAHQGTAESSAFW